jgi:hypothetical protein
VSSTAILGGDNTAGALGSISGGSARPGAAALGRAAPARGLVVRILDFALGLCKVALLVQLGWNRGVRLVRDSTLLLHRVRGVRRKERRRR